MAGVSKTQKFYPFTNDRQFLWAGLMSNIKSAFKKAQTFGYPIDKVFIFLKTKQQNFQVRSIKLNKRISSPLSIEDDLKQAFLKLYRKNASYQSVSCHLTS